MTPRQRPTWRSVVLDAQALSLWLDGDRPFLARLAALAEVGTTLVVCANTVIELASHPAHRLLDWHLSRTRVAPVTAETARLAGSLLRETGLTGHRHAIDASVAAVALTSAGPVAVLTSDPADLYRLCQGRADILRV